MSTTKTDATRTLIATALSLVLLTSCSNSQEATSNFSDKRWLWTDIYLLRYANTGRNL